MAFQAISPTFEPGGIDKPQVGCGTLMLWLFLINRPTSLQ
jgi:hypothetical protein